MYILIKKCVDSSAPTRATFECGAECAISKVIILFALRFPPPNTFFNFTLCSSSFFLSFLSFYLRRKKKKTRRRRIDNVVVWNKRRGSTSFRGALASTWKRDSMSWRENRQMTIVWPTWKQPLSSPSNSINFTMLIYFNEGESIFIMWNILCIERLPTG